MYLGSLDIVHTAPTYAVEQAAIMVQGVWRKRQGWKMLMAAMASVTVNNVEHTADAGGPYTTDEGVDVTVTAAASTDPGNVWSH